MAKVARQKAGKSKNHSKVPGRIWVSKGGKSIESGMPPQLRLGIDWPKLSQYACMEAMSLKHTRAGVQAMFRLLETLMGECPEYTFDRVQQSLRAEVATAR